MSERVPPLASGVRPLPADEGCDTGTPLCPELPADLHYVDDRQPGISRRKLRGRFAYFSADGERIRDDEEVRRINALAIPPAYSNVWICPDPQGHLQAVGRDARGRKQYRYHPRWREVRDSNKYERMLDFGLALPALRRRVEADLALRSLCRDKVMATVIALLDSTLIRVGNPQYARQNKSFGLTTLRNRHVEVSGGAIRFHFRGKGGIEHRVSLDHPRLARAVRRCMELPGQQLFQYLDDDGQRRDVSSADVNAYLQEHAGSDFSAKDYRTWAGSAQALHLLRQLTPATENEARSQVVEVTRQVSQLLGNTPAICRKCYIHPAVIEAFLDGSLAKLRASRPRQGLREEESLLLRFLGGQAPGN
ncbi:DNA topoisomerase IB [Pseudomonas sp. Gutcm_11s]|uniref:DNA topoisomerase IB n=1 Tax=Pseudomonas sp. Gutcm_11s TaxID=3026088 RepID=UPI00236028AA|nr:DNA topoisomerase IB [Pseudomonas sp. Gutcm_11s]MDD0843957.1 DNA topoisomerase IB [Pseudomonas sp. Gutcm_11s]